MKLSLRTKLTAWYTTVLVLAVAGFGAIADYGFQDSIDTTVNDASRADVASIQEVLVRTVPKGPAEVADELNEVAGLWTGSVLLEVSNPQGQIIFQSAGFRHPDRAIPEPIQSELRFATANLDATEYRIASQIVAVDGQKFRVRAAVPTEPFDQALDRFRVILKGALPLLVIFAALAGYWLSGRALSPVNAIIQTARGIGVSNLSGRLAVPAANDELRHLSETLNAMLGRIELSVKRLTQFTADASHDLRTPIALIRTSAELALRRSRSADEYRETLARILSTSEETTRLIEDLLTLARADAGAAILQLRSEDIVPHVTRAAEQSALLAAAKSVQFSRSIPAAPLTFSLDSRAIERLLLILLENAVKYTPAGGSVSLQLTNEGERVSIEVRDTGIGISERDLPHIFERFYRADVARTRDSGGSGLGLAIARWIVEQHGGVIEAQSTLGGGSIFRVTLPLAGETQASPELISTIS
jgi:heavy metal sensor kinase